MKKICFALIVSFLFSLNCFAQTQSFSDDYENITVDSVISEAESQNETDVNYGISESKNFDPDIAREFANDMTEIPSPNDILGIALWQKDSLISLVVLFAFNLLICWLIVHFLYYRKSKRKDYYFTFMLFSTTVFLLMNLLNNVNLAMGFAMGLFAIFGMIRYRTEPLPIREMTYLFVTIGISVINGLAMSHGYLNLLIVNVLFILVIVIFDGNKAIKHVATKIVLYEKIELVKHGRENELIADLKERTGLDIQQVEVGHIDFLRDVAYVKIYYKPFDNQINTIDTMVKAKDFMK